MSRVCDRVCRVLSVLQRVETRGVPFWDIFLARCPDLGIHSFEKFFREAILQSGETAKGYRA